MPAEKPEYINEILKYIKDLVKELVKEADYRALNQLPTNPDDIRGHNDSLSNSHELLDHYNQIFREILEKIADSKNKQDSNLVTKVLEQLTRKIIPEQPDQRPKTKNKER